MKGQTLSEWVNENLFKPKTSVINHPNDQKLFICGYYRTVTFSACGMQIVGLFHLNYVGYQELSQPTLNTITRAMFGSQSKDSVRKSLKQLVSDGWLDSCLLSGEDIKKTLCSKQPQALSIGVLNCEWCGCETVALQCHHYPIPRSKGGTEEVEICANCHFEFHQLLSVPRYTASDKLIKFFETPVPELTGGENYGS